MHSTRSTGFAPVSEVADHPGVQAVVPRHDLQFAVVQWLLQFVGPHDLIAGLRGIRPNGVLQQVTGLRTCHCHSRFDGGHQCGDVTVWFGVGLQRLQGGLDGAALLVSDAGTGFENIKMALIKAGASVRSSA